MPQGPLGRGKTTAITDFLEDIATKMPTPSDWCYVHNFADEYQPNILKCHPGLGKQLKQDMRRFIQAERLAIPQLFEGDDYAAKRDSIVKRLNQKRQEAITKMGQLAEEEGFVMQLTSIGRPAGISLVPVVKGRPLSDDEFVALPADAQKRIAQKREELRDRLAPLVRQMRDLETHARDEIAEFDKDVALYAIEHLMSSLNEKYKDYEEITAYLKEIESHIVDDLDRFRKPSGEKKESAQDAWLDEVAYRVYDVNVIADNSNVKVAPIITEQNPTFDNLLGRIEKESLLGTLTTDFTLIRGGSIHKANGGFLVIRAEQLLRDLNVYEGLKRALKSQEIQIEDLPQRAGYTSVRTIVPKPIPLDVKIVLIGDSKTYQLLFAYDPEFRELFKVKADFDSTMDRADENLRDYSGFFATLVTKENLKHLDASAISRLLEYSSRIADDQNKLSTRFGLVADIVREAHIYASQKNAKYVTAEHVDQAIESRIYRSNLVQEKLREFIQKNFIFISTDGTAVGQINGLSVLSVGDFSFGAPSRITVAVGLGKEGLRPAGRNRRAT